jgi:hypothetical protein
LRPERFHHTGPIPAGDHRIAALKLAEAVPVAAHLGVHRIDRHRLHAHQQIGAGGFRHRQFDLLQRLHAAEAVLAEGPHPGGLGHGDLSGERIGILDLIAR